MRDVLAFRIGCNYTQHPFINKEHLPAYLAPTKERIPFSGNPVFKSLFQQEFILLRQRPEKLQVIEQWAIHIQR